MNEEKPLPKREFEALSEVVVRDAAGKPVRWTIRRSVQQEEFINHHPGQNLSSYHEMTLVVTLRRECNSDD